MRSRRIYTPQQASAVMALLRHRHGADRKTQKADRNELRTKYGFWISDFWVGFTDADFRSRVSDGTFKITKG